MANPFSWAWGQVVITLAGPAESAATRQGIEGGQDRNAFAHAYSAAMLTFSGIGSFTGTDPSKPFTVDTADLLGRMKEGVPGYLGMNEFRDYYKDMWNNSIGFDIGVYARNNGLSRSDVERMVKNALLDDVLIRSDKPGVDSRIPNDPQSSFSEWPIPVPQKYIPYSPGTSIDLPECFLANTPILMSDGCSKQIQEIAAGDQVFAYDPEDSLTEGGNAYRRVVRVFSNISRHVIDLRGLLCTPGHAFLTVENHDKNFALFKTIGKILRDDSTIVDANLHVTRARTGALVGSAEDTCVRVVYHDYNAGIKRSISVRAGIPVAIDSRLGPAILDKKDSLSLMLHLLVYGVKISREGTFTTSDGQTFDAIDWPAGSTPFDTIEMQNWVVTGPDGQPYTPPWIVDLPEEDERANLRVVGEMPSTSLSAL